jgi:nucleotide-binding universal stress UspA family protein
MERAAATQSNVHLIYVVSQDLRLIGPKDADEFDRECARILGSEAAYARSLAPDVPVETSLMHGNAMRELVTASRKASMVVVGTHKTGFIRGRVFGSRSIVLAAGSHTPVAVIPETSGRRRHGVIVGMDDSPAGRAAIRFGAIEAVRTNQTLRLVSAWGLPDPALEEFQRESDEHLEADVRAMLDAEVDLVREEFPTLEVHSRVIRLPAAEALVDASSSAALVVLGNSGPVSDGQGLLGSVAHDVLVNLAGPTVIVHAAKSHKSDRSALPVRVVADDLDDEDNEELAVNEFASADGH